MVRLDTGDSITSRQFAPSADYVWGFYIRFSNLDPDPAADFMRSTSVSIRLRLKTDGNLAIIDANNSEVAVTSSTPFAVETWHRVELRWRQSNSGDAEVWVDGSQILNVSGEDFLAG